MKNISFDNPYWLFLALPLLLVVLLPYFLTKNKDNKSPRWLLSLVLHLTMVVCVTLAAAGLTHTTVMTRTKVYVLADVSYSSKRNLDKIDEYIEEISDDLPPNSLLGIVCFGKDTQILTSSGEKIKSVKEATVDDSGTDIAKAIDETATYFSEGELKRIILVTDGFDTTADGGIAAAVERAVAKDIKIDAVYLDNNLKAGEAEVQISDVGYTQSTFLNHETSASVSVQASVESDVMLTLAVKAEGEEDYDEVDTVIAKADVGVNRVNFDLPTDRSGVFEYKVTLSSTQDFSLNNNVYTFTQTVTGQQKVLLITGNAADIETFMQLYGSSATISPYLINGGNKDVPYTVEALSQYDEIIVSNVDIREINNINAFIDSADAVISQYGKSLLTFGDLHMQNTDNDVFARFEELLPVSFGNANKDAKLYTIVMDISRSMYYARPAQLIVAKDAATKLVSILDDKDYVCLVTFAGDAKVVHLPNQELGKCREEVYQKIQNVEPSQGTFIGAALDMAYDQIRNLNFEEKQVMLISDGKTYTNEPEDALAVAEKMKNEEITLSTVLVLPHSPTWTHGTNCAFLSELATAGGGIYYELLDENKVAELVFATIGDTLTEAIVEGKTKVNVQSYRDGVLEGLLSVPDVYGYVNSKAKLDATTVLTVDYKKNSTTTVQAPLYSYREYGNGRVASFTSNVSGTWLSMWEDTFKSAFFGNVLSTNTPKERIDYPYELTFEHLGQQSTVSIAPTHLNPRAKTTVEITAPDGSRIKQQLLFDLNKYQMSFDTDMVGRYHIKITYSYGNHSFTSSTYYTVAYGREYDAFAAYDVGNVYDFMRGLGQVSTDGKLRLENDKGDVATYERDFKAPLLVFAAVLFVVDVFIRKFGWKDVKGFFRKSSAANKREEVRK